MPRIMFSVKNHPSSVKTAAGQQRGASRRLLWPAGLLLLAAGSMLCLDRLYLLTDTLLYSHDAAFTAGASAVCTQQSHAVQPVYVMQNIPAPCLAQESSPAALLASALKQTDFLAGLLPAVEAAELTFTQNADSDLRPRLVYGTLQPGESFRHFARRLSLSSEEILRLTAVYAGKAALSELQAGDSMRVLFNSIGKDALIDAVEVTSQAAGRVAFYRNPADQNFYAEDSYRTATAGVLRRFPLAIAPVINSRFNVSRRHPVTGRYKPHYGVDLKAPVGTPVYAPASGTVTFAGYQKAAGYYITVDHGHGYTTTYMHLSKIKVRKGESITTGQVIARTGNTGRTTGPHLHYEVRINDKAVDPLKVELPSAAHAVMTAEQKEALQSRMQVFRRQLHNEALASVR